MNMKFGNMEGGFVRQPEKTSREEKRERDKILGKQPEETLEGKKKKRDKLSGRRGEIKDDSGETTGEDTTKETLLTPAENPILVEEKKDNVLGQLPSEQPEDPNALSRKGAMITLGKIDLFDKLNADTVEEGDEKFKAETRKLWKEFVTHGKMKKNENGEWILDPHSDLDGKCCLGLLDLALNVDEEEKSGKKKKKLLVEYAKQGGYTEGKIMVDTGNKHGLVMEDKDGNIIGDKLPEGDITTFIDHHAPESRRNSSATKFTYELLTSLGLLDKKEYLDKLVEFVTQADNKTFPEQEKYFKDSYHTILGLERFITFNHLKDYFEKGEDPTRILTSDELHDYGFIYNGYKGRKINRSEEQEKSINLSLKQLEKIEKEGFIIDSPYYGKIVVDINGQIPAGYDAVLAQGGDVYINWNKPSESFFISSKKDITDNLKQGENQRGGMWIKPRHDKAPLTVTLEDILMTMTNGQFTPTGELAKFIEEERRTKTASEAEKKTNETKDEDDLNVLFSEGPKNEKDIILDQIAEIDHQVEDTINKIYSLSDPDSTERETLLATIEDLKKERENLQSTLANLEKIPTQDTLREKLVEQTPPETLLNKEKLEMEKELEKVESELKKAEKKLSKSKNKKTREDTKEDINILKQKRVDLMVKLGITESTPLVAGLTPAETVATTQEQTNPDGASSETAPASVAPELTEAAAQEQIDSMSKKDKKTLFEGLANFGFRTTEWKSKLFSKIFHGIAGKTEKDKKNVVANFFDNYGNIYDKMGAQAKKQRETIGKGGLSKLSGAGQGAGNLFKYGRVFYDIADKFGFHTLNPLRHATAIAMLAGRTSSAIKETRLGYEGAKEKTRAKVGNISINADGSELEFETEEDKKNYERAADEAWKIYEKAKQENGEVSAKDLDKAYRDNLPQDILERLNRFDKNKKLFSSSVLEVLLNKDLKFIVKRMEKSLEKIENGKLSEKEAKKEAWEIYNKAKQENGGATKENLDKVYKEEKEKKIQNLLRQNELFLNDLDRIVGDQGTLDQIAYWSRTVEAAGKDIANILIVDSVGRLAYGSVNIFHAVEKFTEDHFLHPVEKLIHNDKPIAHLFAEHSGTAQTGRETAPAMPEPGSSKGLGSQKASGIIHQATDKATIADKFGLKAEDLKDMNGDGNIDNDDIAKIQAEKLGVKEIKEPLSRDTMETLEENRESEIKDTMETLEENKKSGITNKILEDGRVSKIELAILKTVLNKNPELDKNLKLALLNNPNIKNNQEIFRGLNDIIGKEKITNIAQISKGESISEVLNKTMTPGAIMHVINPDGETILSDFDADLVHPGDTIIETEDGQIYAYKTSGIEVRDRQRLQAVYDKAENVNNTPNLPEQQVTPTKGPEWELVGLKDHSHFYKADFKDFSNEYGIKGEIVSAGGDSKIPDTVHFYGNNGEDVYSEKIHSNESSKEFLERAEKEVRNLIKERESEFNKLVRREITDPGDSESLINNGDITIEKAKLAGINIFGRDGISTSDKSNLEFWGNHSVKMGTNPEDIKKFFAVAKEPGVGHQKALDNIDLIKTNINSETASTIIRRGITVNDKGEFLLNGKEKITFGKNVEKPAYIKGKNLTLMQIRTIENMDSGNIKVNGSFIIDPSKHKIIEIKNLK